MATVRRIDSSGNYNIVNTGVFDEVSPLTAGSLYYNGTTAYLTAPLTGNPLDWGASANWTFEVWIYPLSRSIMLDLLNRAAVSFTSDWAIYIDTDGKFKFYIYPGTTLAPASTTVPLNTWTHLALCIVNGTVTLYQNGVAVTTPTAIGAAPVGQADTAYFIGGGPGNPQRFPNHYMTGMRVVKSALYTSNFTPSTIPPTNVSNTSLLLSVLSSGSATTDTGSNALTITNNGPVTYSGTVSPFIPVVPTGTYGGSLSFNGSNQYLSIAANTTVASAYLFSASNFTIEAWVYLTSIGATATGIVNNWQGGGEFIFVITSAGYLQFAYTNTASGISTVSLTGTTAKVMTGMWNHVAVVRNGNVLTFYVNGVADATTRNMTGETMYYYNGASKDLRIGVSADLGAGTYLNGYITNVRIVNGTAVYTSNFTPSAVPLTNITNTSLLLDAVSSSTATTDTSSKAFTIVNNNTATYNTSSPLTGSVVQKTDSVGNLYSGVGIFDEVSPISAGSLSFNGTSQYLSVPSNTALPTGNQAYTIEAWVYPTSYNTSNGIIGWGTWGSTLAVNALKITSTQIVNYWWAADLIVNYVVPLNTWTHIVAQFDGTTRSIFVNGILIGSDNPTTTNHIVPSPVTNCTIGYTNTLVPEYFPGYITNIRVITGSALYSGNFTPSTVPLTNITNTSLLLASLTPSAATTDTSPNAFTITNNGTVTYSGTVSPFIPVVPTGTYGGSLSFSGTGQYLDTPSNTAFTLGTGDYTIESLIYWNGGATRIAGANSGSTDAAWGIVMDVANDGSFNFGGFTTGTKSTLKITTGTWNHFAWSRQGTTERFFVNGLLSDTVTRSYNFTTTANRIGGAWNTNSPFNGKITNFRIVKGAAVYTSAFTPPTTPLTNITGTSLLVNVSNSTGYITDSSSNAFTLTPTGAVAYDTASPLTGYVVSKIDNSGSQYIDGVFDEVSPISSGSISFNGSNQYLYIPNAAGLASYASDFTVELWMYPTTLSGGPFGLAGQYKLANGRSWIMYLGADGSVTASGNAGSGASAAGLVTPNKWYHLAWVKSGSVAYLYLNGIQVASTSATSPAASTEPITIGANNDAASPTWFFPGYITNFRIVKGTALYSGNFQPPVIPLQSITNTSVLLAVLSSGAFITDIGPNTYTVTNGGTATYSSTITPYPF